MHVGVASFFLEMKINVQGCTFLRKDFNFARESRVHGKGKHAQRRNQNRGAFHALPAPEIYTTE